MFDNERMVLNRLNRLVSERIVPASYQRRAPLTLTAWRVPDEPVPFDQAVAQAYTPISPGDMWGEPWSTMWVHVTGQAPDDWLIDGAVPGGYALEVLADLGFTPADPGFQAEGMYYSAEGRILKAVEPRNRWLSIAPGPIDLYIEAAANPDLPSSGTRSFQPTLLGDKLTAPKRALYQLGSVDVVLRDVTVWELVQDLTALVGLLNELPADSTRRACILRGFEHFIDVIDPDDVSGTAEAGRTFLAPLLAQPANASAHRIFAVGHAHIDCAWLWPLRETKRKVARTFSNQLALMDGDPDFIFASSSAQQFAWVEQNYPGLFERIREHVAAGQFQPMGSMWVESDTNMVGGEAMVRQFTMGKRYFLSRFGIETHETWLPDSFGYSGALPQIARLAGSPWFLSQKLSWNETDQMPHHTFRWEGIDGTRVLAHFPPADTYNSDVSARDLLHAERNFRDKGVASASILPYGWGDGGGGPTREMIASAHRFADLEGAPRVRMSGPAEFFADAKQDYADPPVWRGEMYLELHRGTYTSQAKTKQGNRRNEHLLREAELWATTAAVREGFDYPYDELDELWQTVLLHQFHDILPGSAIGWVHREAEETHARVSADLGEIIDAAATSLVGTGSTELLLNASPNAQAGVPALGIGVSSPVAGEPVQVSGTPDTGLTIGNGLIRVHVTTDGTIDSLCDLIAEREIIPAGTGANLLQLHRDTPRHWDAWDIEQGYERVVQDLTDLTSLSVESSEDCACVRIEREFGESRIVQEVKVRRGSASVEIVNDIDWFEKQKLLKLSFPCDLITERSASETQFGHVWRPTHANTSWDWAKYEICAQRWVRIDEGGYGVSVANSSTYGHDISRQVTDDGQAYTRIRLSLLHAPLYPDPRADHGHYQMSIVLHPGASLAETIDDGYRLNLPRRIVTGGHGAEPLVSVDGEGILVEAVKLADDRSGDVIVRLYESLGRHSRAIVTPQFEHGPIVATDLMECTPEAGGVHEAGRGVTISSQGAALDLHPFQVVTLRIVRG